MGSKIFCVWDCETFSKCDLILSGGWEYSKHPSTELICVAFRVGTLEELPKAKTQLWIPGLYEKGFENFYAALKNPEIDLVAHNAIFEQMIAANVLTRKLKLPEIPVERWHCTAAMSRAFGLPGSLEAAGAALGLAIQKDKEGKKLIQELCIPRKPTKKDPSTRNRNPDRIRRLAKYCVTDVDVTVDLFLKVPKLIPIERKFWCLNQRMNLRGFAVDRALALGALKLIDMEAKRLDDRTKEITGGKISSARQREEVLKFVKSCGLSLPNLQAGTVEEALQNTNRKGRERAFELLEIRQSVSRSSTAKWAAFEARTRSDGRCRDTQLWFGAHTGRDAGRGPQPQNLPSLSSPAFKTGIKQADVDAGLELIRRADFHALLALYPSLMELLAGSLRSCIVASEGKLLEVGDFATIEVRVLFWLAGEMKGLKALANGEPLYSDMAGEIHGLPGAEIERVGQRQK